MTEIHPWKIAWHVPNDAEIDFILQTFKDVIEPALQALRGLLDPGGVNLSLVSSALIDIFKACNVTPFGVMTSVGKKIILTIYLKAFTNHTRYLTFVRNAFSGIPTFVRYHTTTEDWRATGKTSDIQWVASIVFSLIWLNVNRNELAEMIAFAEPLKCGFCLDDFHDPRHQYVVNLRRSYGEFLHEASASLLQQGEENTVDAVHMLVIVINYRLYYPL